MSHETLAGYVYQPDVRGELTARSFRYVETLEVHDTE